MDAEAICRLCSKAIRPGAHTLEFGGEAVHVTCAAQESRLQSLFLREESHAIAERVANTIQRAKAATLPPNASILVGRIDSITAAERRFVVGGVAFDAAAGVSLARLKRGAIVRVIYEQGRGVRRAAHVRPLGVPR
jgi:hypothetical protein